VTRPGRSRVGRALLLLLLASGAPACNQRAIESWLSQAEPTDPGPSLYTDASFSRAVSELRKRAPAPVQMLSLLVYPDHAVLQTQDPAAPNSVLQYVYRAGVVSPPVPVKLMGTGKLEDNLFPMDAVKLDAIPKLAQAAQARANIPEGVVSRVLLKRNLPESMDIQFRVFVTSQRRDAYLDADQSGTLIE
jgi:hypothetical protein